VNLPEQSIWELTVAMGGFRGATLAHLAVRANWFSAKVVQGGVYDHAK